jgi:hypothetical protein
MRHAKAEDLLDLTGLQPFVKILNRFNPELLVDPDRAADIG